jgi:hypothetical protein
VRRQDRDGPLLKGYQYHVNQKLAATHVENERGWRIPNTVEEGFEALNLSLWWLHYRVIWFQIGVLTCNSKAERDEAWRNARWYLERSRQCPAPRLP